MLVVSGMWLGLGVLATLMMVFMLPIIMRQQPGKVPPGMQHAIIVGIIGFMAALGVLLPAIFLFFYSRKSVKATCRSPKGAQIATPAVDGTPARGLPVPLAILGVWLGLGAFSVLFVLFMRVALLFGFVLHGVAAVLVLLAFSALSGYAAWATFRQKLIGWQIALFYALLGMINILVTYFRYPDPLQLFREMGLNDQMLRIYNQFPQLLSIIWVGQIVGITVFLVFVLYTRKFFPTDVQA
jgi:hypothetical protein